MAELASWTVRAQKSRRALNAHYWVTLLAAAALIPALRFAGLPVRFTWADYLRNFWFTHIAESIFGGTILYIAGVPIAESLGRFAKRYSRQKLRLVFLAPMIAILILVSGIFAGILLSVATVVILEVKDRAEEDRLALSKLASSVFWPALYMFVGLVVIFAYNDVIASFRYDGAADLVLNRWDTMLLGGRSVSDLAHAFGGRWPGLVPMLDFLYFGMFAQIGGCLAIVALTEGRSRAMQFVGTILMAFYLALALFYLFPATGPYALSPETFSTAGAHGPMIYTIQRNILSTLEHFKSGQPVSVIGYDYYIAFPCMHLVQPLIVLWFLRRWKRMLIVLIAFDVLLVPSILLLQQHYVVDLLAAVPVAALAIAIGGREIQAQSGAEAHAGFFRVPASPNRSSGAEMLSTNGNGYEGQS